MSPPGVTQPITNGPNTIPRKINHDQPGETQLLSDQRPGEDEKSKYGQAELDGLRRLGQLDHWPVNRFMAPTS